MTFLSLTADSLLRRKAKCQRFDIFLLPLSGTSHTGKCIWQPCVRALGHLPVRRNQLRKWIYPLSPEEPELVSEGKPVNWQGTCLRSELRLTVFTGRRKMLTCW